jgi:hypothetical protein
VLHCDLAGDVGVAPVSDGRYVTQVEMDDPPGYFRMAKTGRVHLVRRVTRVTWPDGRGHLMVKFWCSNQVNDRHGELLAAMPPDALVCAGCEQVRYRGLPRART